ncbi:MAG: hypothetical protein WBN40_11855 [Pseudomonadales bacterium]
MSGNCTGSPADPNRVKYMVSAGPTGTEFGWFADYYVYPDNAAPTPTIELFLWIELFSTGTIPASLKQEWEEGIEQTWSNRHGLMAPDGTVYGVNVDVEFINPGGLLALLCGNLRVTVQQGPGAFDLDRWYINPTSPLPQSSLAAHEIGHLLGNFDEYSGGAVNPDDTTYWSETNSIMGIDAADVVWERHYQFLVDWANQQLAPSGGSFQLTPAAFIGTSIHAVPVPRFALLLLPGILLLIFRRNRECIA